MAIKKVLTPAIIEHTNRTYPEYKDILCLVSHFDTMQISFDTYKIHNVEHLFPDKEAEKRRSISMEITYDEAIILRNKLQEFIDAYDEYAKYNFMVGEHETLEIPEPLAPDLPSFTDVKDVKLDDKKPFSIPQETSSSKAIIHPDTSYTYKNPEVKRKVEKMINLVKGE